MVVTVFFSVTHIFTYTDYKFRFFSPCQSFDRRSPFNRSSYSNEPNRFSCPFPERLPVLLLLLAAPARPLVSLLAGSRFLLRDEKEVERPGFDPSTLGTVRLIHDE